MSLVVQQTHYMPKRWRGRENSDSVRVEFETLFQVKNLFASTVLVVLLLILQLLYHNKCWDNAMIKESLVRLIILSIY